MNYISEEKCIEYTGLITSWSDVSIRRLIKKIKKPMGHTAYKERRLTRLRKSIIITALYKSKGYLTKNRLKGNARV